MRFTSKDHIVRAGETLEKRAIVINNSRRAVSCEWAWSLALPDPLGGEGRMDVPTGEQRRAPIRCALPAGLTPGEYVLSASFRFSTGEVQEDRFPIQVMPGPAPAPGVPEVALYDPRGETGRLLGELGVRWRPVAAADDLAGVGFLIVGKGALAADGPGPDVRRVREGLRVVVFEQTASTLEKRFGFRVAEYGLRQVFRRVPDHPALAGLQEEHLRDWRGSATLLPPRLEYEPSTRYAGAPVVRWCGLEVPRVWRCGCRGNVASVLIEKPARGDFLPLCDGGFSLQYSPLLEYREGRGLVLFCQMDVTGRTESDPAAAALARNLLAYAASWQPPPERQALYAGPDAGREHLALAGVASRAYEGGSLSPNDVLVVAAGGGRRLAAARGEVAAFLRAGGHVLALGLDESEANAFLPNPIRTRSQEHIAAWFEPPAAASPLAGVCPADVHNRDPRELPLVTEGASPVGNGVLAVGEQGSVVFCQLPPWEIVPGRPESPSFTVDAEDPTAGGKSALLVMGTAPWAQFGQKVEAGEPGKTYTIAALVKPLGAPARVRLEVERAARPWDRALRGEEVELPPDQWTDLHATFAVDKPFPEGWTACLHCGQPGARLRVSRFRLAEGEYVPARPGPRTAAAQGQANRFANPDFEGGADPWRFTWRLEQHNLRRTYRRTSFLLTRLLANLGVRGETPLLERFSVPPEGPAGESIVRNGDFRLDTDADGIPDQWQFSADAPGAACTLEPAPDNPEARCVRMACPTFGDKGKGTLMLAQLDVPVREGQWYRIAFRARAAGFGAAAVTLAVQNTATWNSLIEYQRFTPAETWKEHVFLVAARGTAATGTRLQIWHGSTGTLWLSGLTITPCAAPDRGRWTSGLYVDTVQEWDDPYRFFRW